MKLSFDAAELDQIRFGEPVLIDPERVTFWDAPVGGNQVFPEPAPEVWAEVAPDA